MEAAAWEIFDDLEERGGYMQGIETGEIKRAIDTSAYELKQRINDGSQPVVGVNKYVNDTPQNYEAFRIDHAIEEKARARLEEYRDKRDQALVDRAIDGIRIACEDLKEGRGPLMPALIEAARNGVTNGEMMVPMRESFGWFVSE
jgi:methylmalonyl-CoA mutase N-terminal domain/subunit